MGSIIEFFMDFIVVPLLAIAAIFLILVPVAIVFDTSEYKIVLYGADHIPIHEWVSEGYISDHGGQVNFTDKESHKRMTVAGNIVVTKVEAQ